MPDAATEIDGAVATMHELMAHFATIGATPQGGVMRLAASREDGLARDCLCHWLRSNGFDVRVDEIGNIFGCLDLGEDLDDGAVYCGSHLDSQPDGGRFDGTYGVVAACCATLAVGKMVKDGALNADRRYLVVANWTNEEGARFQPSLLGSGVFSGKTPLNQALAATDSNGLPLGAALQEIGYLDSRPGRLDPDWYVEIHVEQGTVLESAERPIGVVTHCWDARKIQLRFRGQPDHTGPTPMARRKDALRAASLLISGISDRALSSNGRLHGSVGRIEVEPNSPNVVPRSATLWVEFRAGDEDELNAAENWLEEELRNIQSATGCSGEILDTNHRDAQAFDAEGLRIAKSGLNAIGLDALRVATIAGHDAVMMQKCCPSILLFVPSIDGVSHSPEERTCKKDLETGLHSLAAVLSALISGTDRQASASRSGAA